MAGTFVKDFWRKSREIDIKTFPCEGEEFDVMALDSNQFKSIQECGTSEEMLHLASNIGQMSERQRISDNTEMSQDFDRFWRELDEELEYNDTPTLREQVGKYVCDISGLSGILEAKLEEEEKEEIKKMLEEESTVDGDSGPQDEIALGLAHHEAIMEAS